MSKKNLLSESTIRKFMKFANIDGLTDNFLQEGAYIEEDEHDAVGEMAHPMEEEEGAGLDAMDDVTGDMDDMDDVAGDMDDMDDVAGDMDDMDDMGAEGGGELPPEAVTALERAVEDAVDSLLAALAPYGVQGDVEVEDDVAAELPGDEGPEDVAAAVGDEEGLDVIDDEEVVNETFNRVTRRLRAMNESRKAETKRDKLADRIASAVAKRLRK
jgi:hypothetical protein